MSIDLRVRVRDFLRGLLPTGHPDDSARDGRFLYVHIPKTAGTAFRHMLYRQFRQTDIFPNLKDIRESSGLYPSYAQLLTMDSNVLSRARLVTGHYPYVTVELFPQRPRCLVFLRDPVHRAVSNLHHLKRHAYPAGTDLAVIMASAPNAIVNVQARFFIEPYHQEPLSRADLEAAKSNLGKCEFVGLSEEFGLSVRLAERMFGWRLGKALTLNVNLWDDGTLDDAFVARLERENAFDIELYEHGKSLFRNLLQRHGMV